MQGQEDVRKEHSISAGSCHNAPLAQRLSCDSLGREGCEHNAHPSFPLKPTLGPRPVLGLSCQAMNCSGWRMAAGHTCSVIRRSKQRPLRGQTGKCDCRSIRRSLQFSSQTCTQPHTVQATQLPPTCLKVTGPRHVCGRWGPMCAGRACLKISSPQLTR